MASAGTLPLKSIAGLSLLAITVAGSRVNINALLKDFLTGPGNKSRIFALLVFLANLKSVPFVWHYRVFNAVFKHTIFDTPNIPVYLRPSCLFLPTITSSRSGLYESDYNLHKSNSTYFSDLDVSRSHLASIILQPGVVKLRHNKANKIVLDPSGKPVCGKWGIMLGSVMCSFKREIGMYEGFEMWSRLLCWDRKWIYIVSHFVKKGTVKPSAYVLTDGSWFGGKGYKKVGGKGTAELDEKSIYASAISKYVIKLGRMTIHPEVTLEASEMLPERPGGWAKMDGTTVPPPTQQMDVELKELKDENLWDWRRVEAENRKGLEFAEKFAALDNLHDEFSGSQGDAMGRYRDFLTV
ncbi:hypothetical protein BJ878DRAFT_435483 [Calycina marina]|uniref:Capsule polysaccharide biosynthesis protein n=1 Tax=Calycina marina TaxID=1763456 RepID=A0A9P8CHK9_9HELO|nr:hypothetical protein BJ878DRAFT_435483 [Calycina marina]